MGLEKYGKKLSEKIAESGKPIGKFYPYYKRGVLSWISKDKDLIPDKLVFATPFYDLQNCGKTIVVTKGDGSGQLIEFTPTGTLQKDVEKYYSKMENWFQKNV